MGYKNEEILESLIVGRVKPHIYAFTTNTIPDYLKVGDTYRPVSVRLREWMKYFPDLQKQFEETATISDDVFFRDYSVHEYLEEDLSKHRLEPKEYPDLYYSNEFFKDVLIENVSDAITDIRENYYKNTGKYKYYDANSQLPQTYSYASTGEWTPRPNQKETIDRFVSAVKAGRTNLLMYAVMRFGKSFTAMCCAKKIGAELVVIVSAKADVREEWKKTIQSADNFNQDYVFIDSADLLENQTIVSRVLSEGKRAAVFLTLQDLQGDDIKEKHKDIVDRKIDLLIVDETHYGARAEHLGKILNDTKYEKDVKEKHADDDFIELTNAEERLKYLDTKVTLHLSGTPYRILMGREFAKEDIVAFYQFSDIVKDQEEWDQEHLLNDSGNYKEWDNPYFGFPQMIRFAFVPNKSALSVLENLKKSGIKYAFSDLLKPQSIPKDNEHAKHKKFIYEKEVLELLEAIDGSNVEDGILPFLDYEKIKEGKMCQHIVCVLPYRASCDALEELIHSNTDKFKNLKDYTIINISGVDCPNVFHDVQSVKNKIRQCAEKNIKTLTLTVNRMLTGSTVEEWDTMIFLKDTASPQEYDQAIFRLQNQYIREYTEPDGDVIRYNMKPQTLLVDFDPHRMFVMQEQKSQIYNANVDASGNEHLRSRLDMELRISPIITINKNQIVQVEPKDILSEISEYSSNRGVFEETMDIPVDMALRSFDTIRAEIDRQAELGEKQGFQTDAYSGEGNDMEGDDGIDKSEDTEHHTDKNEKDNTLDAEVGDKDVRKFENQFRTYYARILFFSFLTKSVVSSLNDIIISMDKDDNIRIAKNLKLERDILTLIKEHINIFILRQLDYKIQNINSLSHDETVEPLKRAAIAIRKFGRISEAEITTPEATATAVIDLIPDTCFEELNNHADTQIMDIASKMGEFAVAVVKRCMKLGLNTKYIENKVLSVTTSPIAYEFTRKVYEVLGLNVNCIAEKFNSMDFLGIKMGDEISDDSNNVDYMKISALLSQKKLLSTISLSDEITDLKEEDKMKFSAIVGNPPYQEDDGGAGASSKPIYQHFVNISRSLEPSFASIIIPTRWFSGGKNLVDFRKSMLDDRHIKELHDCLHPEEIFPNTNNRGGICYFLWDKNYDNVSPSKTKVVTHNGNGEVTEAIRSMRVRDDLDIFIRSNKAISILDKVAPSGSSESMTEHISSRKPFGIESNIIKTTEWHTDKSQLVEPIACYGKRMQLGYIEHSFVKSNIDMIDKWKVYTPRANNIGTELSDDNLNTFLGEPGTICTEAYMVVGCDLNLTEESAKNLMGYFKTKFVRFMHSLAKASQDATKKTYRFVPVVDFSETWTDEKLYAKFGLSHDEIELIENSIKEMA